MATSREGKQNPGMRPPSPTEGGQLQLLPRLILDRLRPDFPDIYGMLLSDSRELDLAAWRIRLAGLHLSPSALLSLDRVRVVVGELDGQRLTAEVEGMVLSPRRAGTVRALLQLLMDGRLMVKCAPLGGWSPDFSLFRGQKSSATLLLGPHWLERPFVHRGPALASLHSGPEVSQVEARFEELWEEAHDVRAAVLRMLMEAARRGEAAAPP